MNRATDDLLAAWRSLLRELRDLGWQVLLIGSGFYLEIAVCAERFAADWAAALERRLLYAKEQPTGSRPRRFMGSVWAGIFRVVRRAEPGIRAWRQQAARWDTALLARRGPARRREAGD